MQPDRNGSGSLPRADTASLAHSARVADYLRAAIDDAGGSITFGEFMHHVLYAPGLGYYAAGTEKFGAGGDFVTAPEVSPLFGGVLARRIAPILKDDPTREVLELGPGSGALMTALLGRLQELDAVPAAYRIMEVSPDLVERQRARLVDERPDLASCVHWQHALPAGFRGVVIANEVLDALPVERFVRTATGVEQVAVVRNGDGFDFARLPAPAWLSSSVRAIEQDLGRELPRDYLSELSPGLPGWIDELAASLAEGVIFLFDYGLARHEYYAPDRSGGWLRCHFRHRAHEDALRYPGIQDLSAWVDFTAAAEAASTSGLDVVAWLTQSRFLLDGGLAEEIAGFEAAAAARRLDLSRQVQLLTLPGEMGEHFKCLVLSRGNIAMPASFADGDRSHAL